MVYLPAGQLLQDSAPVVHTFQVPEAQFPLSSVPSLPMVQLDRAVSKLMSDNIIMDRAALTCLLEGCQVRLCRV